MYVNMFNSYSSTLDSIYVTSEEEEAAAKGGGGRRGEGEGGGSGSEGGREVGGERERERKETIASLKFLPLANSGQF